MIEYFLESETPSKKNSKVFNTKTHKLLPSQRYKAWHEYAALMIKRFIKECVNDNCYIILIFCHGDKIRRDSDNGVSSIFDMLVDFKALEDDCWQIVRNHHVFNTYDKGKPWCKIRIYKPDEKDLFKAEMLKCIDMYM